MSGDELAASIVNFQAPLGWEVIQQWGDGWALRQLHGGLRVLIDCECKDDGKRWIHVSVSRKSWTPTHQDMALVKQDFFLPSNSASFRQPEDRAGLCAEFRGCR